MAGGCNTPSAPFLRETMTDNLTELNLFSGAGMIAYAACQAGLRTVALCEIEKACYPVLHKHFPNTPIYPDMKELQIDELPTVGVVTFGSPCQDLSIAGKQAGMKIGTRSNLFHEAIRIIRQLRERDGNLPRFALWENVPNALNSNKGRDFAKVLDAFLDIGARDIAWRVLDAQWHGVAQRRERVFLVADFGGECADEILSLPESLYWYPAPSRKTGKGLASDVAASLRSRSGKNSGHPGTDGEEGLAVVPDIAFALTTKAGQRHEPSSDTYIPCVAPTLSSSGARTARTGNARTEVDMLCTAFNWQSPATLPVKCRTEHTGALQANQTPAVMTALSVRRLTPLETVRLMGLPDDWFADLGLSDSAIYKMTGNGAVWQCITPILEKIAEHLKSDDL